MTTWTPRRLSSVFAAIVIPLCAIALTACEPECVDKFDCRGKGAPGQTMACENNQCVVAPPEADAGQPVEDAGTEEDAGQTVDAGEVDAGELDAGIDAGQLDAGIDAGQLDAGIDAGVDAGFDAGIADAGFFKLTATLTGDQAEPPIASPHFGQASFTVNQNVQSDAGLSVVWAVTWGFDGGGAITTSLDSVDVYSGPSARNGTLVQNLCTSTAGVGTCPTTQAGGGSFVVSQGQANAMIAGRWYVTESITTTTIGTPIADTIRGQIIQPGELLFTARMTGDQETPPTGSPATGGAQVLYPSDGGNIRYFGLWDLLDGGTQAAHIHEGDAGFSGGVIVGLQPFTLADGGQGVLGTADAGSLDVVKLNNGQYYINAHSNAFPGGEIRGQLERKN